MARNLAAICHIRLGFYSKVSERRVYLISLLGLSQLSHSLHYYQCILSQTVGAQIIFSLVYIFAETWQRSANSWWGWALNTRQTLIM